MRDAQLPITHEPHDAESAMGYCLRCVAANGTNLHWLRRAAGVPAAHMFTSDHARALAWVLQCSESWLEAELGKARRMNGITRWFGVGQEVFSSNHLRGRWPQLCPACVHLQGYCERAWELSTMTICPRHQCELIDECRFCRARLRWDRPSVDTCQCGRAFQLVAIEPVEDTKAIEFCELLDAALDCPSFAATAPLSALPGFLRGMSLGGLQSLVDILGALEHQLQVVHASRRRRALRTRNWAVVVRRALDCLGQAHLSGPDWPSGVAMDEAALVRLLDRATCPVDLRVALPLALAIYGNPAIVLGRSTNQLSLRFADTP